MNFTSQVKSISTRQNLPQEGSSIQLIQDRPAFTESFALMIGGRNDLRSLPSASTAMEVSTSTTNASTSTSAPTIRVTVVWQDALEGIEELDKDWGPSAQDSAEARNCEAGASVYQIEEDDLDVDFEAEVSPMLTEQEETVVFGEVYRVLEYSEEML
ncbi:hypothetical protein K435DRAFT_808387 [Dendrothele bispora CBS 962.96]|uniref:Uncharacterized protein n=1 Tax=Dendrothele bispora (strain CBS 962.96) TaxID=1314807 RepID=A0A4S8L206_DENBC|nr:hypothetical protein K435DRAFT_808387 [Dendrothele bispora CBS 962.96]